MVAGLKKINVVAQPDETFKKLTVTFNNPDLITIDEAWKYMNDFLSLGGYCISKRDGQYVIVPAENGLFQKEILRLYVNVSPDDLPRGSERIRVMFYLSNLPVPDSADKADKNVVHRIFVDMLSPGVVPLYDPSAKAIMVADKADLISLAMRVVMLIDKAGVQETLEVIPLYNAVASEVEALLKGGFGIRGPGENTGRTQRADNYPFFSPNTFIAHHNPTNSLILLGREAAVERT